MLSTMRIKTTASPLLLSLLIACSTAPKESPKEQLASAAPSVAAKLELSDEAKGPIAKELAIADKALDAIAALNPEEVTFENSLAAYDAVIANFFNATRMRAFMENVSMDADERGLGTSISADMGTWFSKLNKRRDLYRVFKAFADSKPQLDEQDARLLALTLRDFTREGMGLEEESRNRLAAIDLELNQLGIEFRGNISADRTLTLLSKAELAGCDEAFLASLPRAEALYIVASTGPNLTHIVTYCTQPETRKKSSRCARAKSCE